MLDIFKKLLAYAESIGDIRSASFGPGYHSDVRIEIKGVMLDGNPFELVVEIGVKDENT